VVLKDEVLSAVWEDHFVEEANLAGADLDSEKGLGEKRGAPRFLVTVPGKRL
jgi:DNA-binding winged helix-turn-helix (wHTH) protein